ncbi:MAG: type III-B CRISPR module RAMP protein Cmr1 [Firmicutes bacterium]|nr:type III-B CRISPR module RAMP protein Cmr1 [Bacillota bacterium]
MVTKISVNTVTPIYMGDAFGINEIKPQTIIGSLRFWFEIFLKAVNQLPSSYNYKDENLNLKKYNDDVLKIIAEGKSLNEAKIKAYEKISLPSQIFGCNGLKSKIAIKSISQIDADNHLNLKRGIYVPKDRYYSENIRRSKKKEYSRWFFPPAYFYGYFTIEFYIADEDIFNGIFCPLLNFIEKYGYLGAKNNLGFGRVKFELEDNNFGNIKDYRIFRLTNYGFRDKGISEAVKQYNKIEDMYSISNIGLYIKNKRQYNDNNFFAELIEELLKEKAHWRNNLSDNENLRHYIFGTTKDPTNATKIIPWINKVDSNSYEYGFISLAFLDEDMIKKRRCG